MYVPKKQQSEFALRIAKSVLEHLERCVHAEYERDLRTLEKLKDGKSEAADANH